MVKSTLIVEGRCEYPCHRLLLLSYTFSEFMSLSCFDLDQLCIPLMFSSHALGGHVSTVICVDRLGVLCAAVAS
jgi:hypothetical protein